MTSTLYGTSLSQAVANFSHARFFNPFIDNQLFHTPQNRTGLSFWIAFYILFGMQSDQPAICSPADCLHPKQNVECDLKW